MRYKWKQMVRIVFLASSLFAGFAPTLSSAPILAQSTGRGIDPALLAKANAGDANSQLLIGVAYVNGDGTAQDYAQAATWFRKAASQGDAAAQTILGELYAQGHGVAQDNTQAANWYRKAAEQGNTEAQYNLGLLYQDGSGVPQDLVQSAQWIRKAAEQKFAWAQECLGLIYQKGQGVPQDFAQAAIWYRRAAEQGNAAAQFLLSGLYMNGQGVPQDYLQTEIWSRKAAEQGHAGAQSILGVLYENGYGVTLDYAQAAAWYRRAAEQGVAEAQFSLGMLYYNGRGVPRDYSQAAVWFRKAAEHGDAKAQHNLGVLYFEGKGVPRDREQATEWERKATGRSNATAQPAAPNSQDQGLYGEPPVYAQIRADLARKEQERPARELNALTTQNELDRQKAIQQYHSLLGSLQGDPTPEQQAQLDRLRSIIDLGYNDPANEKERVIEDSTKTKAGPETPVSTTVTNSSKLEGSEPIPINLGALSTKDHGDPEDYTQAAVSYRKAAEQGDVTAQYSLAVLYYKGEGIPQNYSEAYFWFSLAAVGARGQNRENVAAARDAAAAKLTPDELLKSQQRAAGWFAAHRAKP